jgi:cardiolipin synthase
VNQLPNIISVFRILLVLPVVWAFLNQEYGAALILFAIAGFTDALDGFLAKRFHWESRLGSILDPLADKLLLVSSFLVLAWIGLIPILLVIVVIVRDLLIVIGGVAFHYLFEKFDMVPSHISKVNTFFQIIFILAVVSYHGEFALTPWVIEVLGNIVLVTTVISGMDYVWVWGRRAIHAAKHKSVSR